VPRAKIKAIEITEVQNLDPRGFAPDDLEDFSRTFGLTIGPSDAEGGLVLPYCLHAQVATRACEKDGFLWGRHHLIVPHYNRKAINQTIEVC
jgi:hypothetical protein